MRPVIFHSFSPPKNKLHIQNNLVRGVSQRRPAPSILWSNNPETAVLPHFCDLRQILRRIEILHDRRDKAEHLLVWFPHEDLVLYFVEHHLRRNYGRSVGKVQTGQQVLQSEKASLDGSGI